MKLTVYTYCSFILLSTFLLHLQFFSINLIFTNCCEKHQSLADSDELNNDDAWHCFMTVQILISILSVLDLYSFSGQNKTGKSFIVLCFLHHSLVYPQYRQMAFLLLNFRTHRYCATLPICNVSLRLYMWFYLPYSRVT